MKTAQTLEKLRSCSKSIREHGGTLALVPTMGALHDGHMALIDEAKRRADHVAVSIFVNPRQFGPKEDFAAYPRPVDADAAKLKRAGVALLWMPDAAVMYPDGYATTVSVAKLGESLCGANRPGHFDGVSTVVAKLFNQVRPDIAIFGEKDWQQLAIIRRMATDLDMKINIIGMPTQREDDGLARSSRNAYLSPEDRLAAVALPRALGTAAKAIAAGGRVNEALETARNHLEKAGFHTVDYVALVDAQSLEPLTRLDREARLLGAARIGKTRLIDNLAVVPV
jgi:pantoate--beta-alanine ligase